MDKSTLQLFKNFKKAIANGYGVGVGDVEESFSVSPSVEQKLTDKIVEKSTFLQKINVLTVKELKGENLLGSITGPISSRTNTAMPGKERTPRNVEKLEKLSYECVKTNRDTAIRYALMDAWAKFPDFYNRILGYVYERIAIDREVIGWYGESVAVDTDLATFPMLQDVNKGWMKYVKERLPENILMDGKKTPGKILIGKGGDFANLDSAVHDLTQGIPAHKRNNLVALIGSGLTAKESASLFDNLAGTPSEKILISQSKAKYGGLPWETPSSFPEYGLVITTLKNLSLYIQEGSQRKQIIDAPKKDQVESYESCNEGYVVEDPEQFVAWDFNAVEFVVENNQSA